MRRLRIALGVAAIAGITALAAACVQTPEVATSEPVSAVPEDYVILAAPVGQGNTSYTLSEVCWALQAKGYDIRGTISHTFAPDAFEGLLERLPSLARPAVEGYLGDGLTLQVSVKDLCQTLNN